MKLGIVVFANNSGLGNQTRRLTYMLKPDRILAIDSTGFSKNKTQHIDWYKNMSGYVARGFPSNQEVRRFMSGLTHVLVCENPLNFFMLDFAKINNIKLYIQSNYEFCDHLNRSLTLPTKFLMPSHWKIQEMRSRFGIHMADYLPPPIDIDEFESVRNINLNRTDKVKKYLHIIGTAAAHDRNGTNDLLESLQYSKSDFRLVIKSQHVILPDMRSSDSRVSYVIADETSVADMYRDFDALILPRRYGGLSLTTNEALVSGLPVIMSNISPNNELLPADWLVDAEKMGEFMTRTMIDIYKTNPQLLAQKIDWMSGQNMSMMKQEAFSVGKNNFDQNILRPKYQSLFI